MNQNVDEIFIRRNICRTKDASRGATHANAIRLERANPFSLYIGINHQEQNIINTAKKMSKAKRHQIKPALTSI